MEIIDAHQHLQDARFGRYRDEVVQAMRQVGVMSAIVNGTSQSDWPEVELLCQQHPHFLIPTFGLHPWHVAQRSSDWFVQLTNLLVKHPHSSVGECGLDRWKKEIDFSEQTDVFRQQLELAKELDRPITIHCLKAWDALMITLKRFAPLPPFLLHSYSGPVDLIPALTRLGAHFSFSGYFLHERKAQARMAFAAVPRDRLLIESDAPDMAPPREMQGNFHHPDFHHPADLPITLRALAALRGIAIEECASLCSENARRLFRLSFAQPQQAQGIEHDNDG